jgi:hypothetical protein
METMTKTVTRFVGHCQICEGEFKLTSDNRMVHHGYKRPGHGNIVGDCMAVGEPAYEQSCEFLKVYTVRLRDRLAETEARLARLVAGEIKSLSKNVRVRLGAGRYEYQLVEVREGEVDFPQVLKVAIANVESDIRFIKMDLARCESRIATWVALPVRTVEELEREVQLDKDARKAAKDAARAKKQAKKDETKAKQDALKAKRDAIQAEFVAKFVALANSPESLVDRQKAALEIVRTLSAKKYEFVDALWMLGINTELTTLGILVPEVYDGRTFYNYSAAAKATF